MTTGAPMTGVMTLIGMRLSEGRVDNQLQSSARQPPVSKVAGNRVRWSDVPSRRRAMCGTASPMNAMGPQKAVLVAVSNPVQQSNKVRVRRT